MVTNRSTKSYAETLAALLAGIERRGLTVFARIDHAAGARQVGMELADEEVLLFGNPRSGTPLMQGDPAIGIELPLRMLIWRDEEGVLLGYNDPRELALTYAVAGHEETLEQMATLLGALVSEAGS